MRHPDYGLVAILLCGGAAMVGVIWLIWRMVDMSDRIEEIKDEISELYSDMDVDQSVTKDRLEELQGHIQDLINSLD